MRDERRLYMQHIAIRCRTPYRFPHCAPAHQAVFRIARHGAACYPYDAILVAFVAIAWYHEADFDTMLKQRIPKGGNRSRHAIDARKINVRRHQDAQRTLPESMLLCIGLHVCSVTACH